MDFLNKAFAQVAELFRSMTPAARITAGLLLAVLVVSVAYLFNHQFAGGDAFLFGGEMVRPRELNAMQAAFAKANLMDAEIDGNRIRVPRGKQALYMGALASEGALPHNWGDAMKRMFSSSSPFISKKKQEEMAKFALQEELSEIIGTMRGIESGTVMFDLQMQGGFPAKKVITSSVAVQPEGKQPLTVEQVRMIRHVVGPAIGAAPESVAVIDQNGRTYPGGAADASGDVSNDRYLNMKRDIEDEFTEKIRTALSFVTGAVVTVNAELNPELDQLENTTRLDPKAVPFDVQENSRTENSTAAGPAGRPGLGSQGSVNAPAVLNSVAGGSRMEQESNDRREKNVVGSTTTQVRKAGLTPKRVTATVAVPSSYYEEVWRQRNAPSDSSPPKKPEAAQLAQIESEENANIRKHVVVLLPPPAEVGTDPLPQVVVTKFDSLPAPEIEKPTTADHALVWFSDHSGALGMGFLGLLSLLMVRSIVRSVPAAATVESPEFDTASQPSGEVAEPEPNQPAAAPRLRRRRSKSGPSLRDDLVEIVREDPDAAANILRNWIGAAN